MPKIGNKFFPGTEAGILSEFIRWCDQHGAPPPWLAELTRAATLYLERRPEPGTTEAAGHGLQIPEAPPIRLSSEPWVDVPGGLPKPDGEP